jgi:hypothetical protein
MRRVFVVISIILIALSIPALGATSSDTEYKDAVLTLFSNANFGMLTRDWCDERSPQLRTSTAKIFQAWWLEQGLKEVEQRVKALYSSDQIAAVKNKVEGVRQNFYSRLDGLFPDAVARCQDLAGYYKQFLNLRQSNAAQYEIMNSRALPSASTKPSNSSQAPQPQTASNTGVLYTVPQINTLAINAMTQTSGDVNTKLKAALEKLKSLGTIYLTGTVVRDHILGFVQGKFKSKYDVYCVCTRNGQSEQIGKSLVVRGRITDVTRIWIELDGLHPFFETTFNDYTFSSSFNRSK